MKVLTLKECWDTRIREGQVWIRRRGKLFVIVCRNRKEADAVEKFIIKALVEERKRDSVEK
jgi:hypothetical protein